LEYGGFGGNASARLPFFRQNWFLVSLAAASVIVLILVAAILCVKSKSYKYKGELVFFFLVSQHLKQQINK